MPSNFEQQTALNFQNINRRLSDIEALENPIVVAMYTQTSGTTSISPLADTVINFDTLVYDPRLAVTVGAGWKFTCPVAGFYQVNASVRLAADSDWGVDTSASMKIYVGGSSVKTIDFLETFTQDTSYTMNLAGSGLVHLNVGDELNVRCAQDADVVGIATVATGTLTWVDIVKVVS